MGSRKLIINYKLLFIIKTSMGALFAKVIQVLKIMPIILYFTKNNKLKLEQEPDPFEDEWGQFCEIEKPLYNHNRDKPL
tara:strand:- start:561 stop:797 length:237 start_codon:yes stop_codon:yes gene_type:complete